MSWPSTAAGSASAAGRPTDDVHSTWNKTSLPPPGAANTSDATGRNTNDRADTTKPPPPSTATT
ncbi:hypothetical protein, partial [Streptosporangium sp. NPDC049304]|uniref:hypothetical protein n=1 Tax=Streptosporangium sp. NPDC049304 TaxID=3154830 RepID=UPI003416AA32